MTLPLFTRLTADVGFGTPPLERWQPIAARPLLVLVGVTGVGKSTTLQALSHAGLAYHLLPDRRALTDRILIPQMQEAAGEPVEPVSDRARRFGYTRDYRARHPGGMGEALASLFVDAEVTPGLLLFDGLRGANEVTFATNALPAAHFVVLEAPDVVRVIRLMGRNDPFDAIAMRGEGQAPPHAARFADLGVPDAVALLTDQEQRALLEMVNAGEVSEADLQAALAIVVEERRNYDPTATRRALEEAAADRTLVVDTVADAPHDVALRILAALRRAP